jgi:phage terminase small subunit
MAPATRLRYPSAAMPRDGLNPRQEAFAQNLVANGMNATAAYKAAGYSAKKDVTARNGAHELLTNPYVAARVSELQKLAAVKHGISLESLTRDLLRLRDRADQLEQISAAVAALALVAKMHGLITDKAQIDVIHDKPARLPTKQLELTEDEWLRLYAKESPTRQAIAAPGGNGNGRNS